MLNMASMSANIVVCPLTGFEPQMRAISILSLNSEFVQKDYLGILAVDTDVTSSNDPWRARMIRCRCTIMLIVLIMGELQQANSDLMMVLSM